MTTIRKHRCHVPGCYNVIRRKRLMCPKHWSLIPMLIRLRVIRAASNHPSREWLIATRDAIEAVQEREQDDRQTA